MAKIQEKDMAETENVQSILGKIKRVVSGKEKVTIEEDVARVSDPADEEPMELTEVVDGPAIGGADTTTGNTQEQQPEQNMAASADDEEGNFVDILKEIDTALEKQYKEDQQKNQEWGGIAGRASGSGSIPASSGGNMARAGCRTCFAA
jgi:hypothetical protein